MQTTLCRCSQLGARCGPKSSLVFASGAEVPGARSWQGGIPLLLIPNPIPAPAFAPGLGRGAANLARSRIIQELKAAIGAGMKREACAAAVRGVAPNAACIQPRPFLEGLQGCGEGAGGGRGWHLRLLSCTVAVKSAALLLQKDSEHVPRRHPGPAAPVAVLLQPRSSLPVHVPAAGWGPREPTGHGALGAAAAEPVLPLR